jgi:hypothetical protein
LSILDQSSSLDSVFSKSNRSHSKDNIFADSSRDSSSDLDMKFNEISSHPQEWLVLKLLLEGDQYMSKRTTWIYNKFWAEYFLNENITDRGFRQMCRMDKSMFWNLIDLVELYYVFHNNAYYMQALVCLQLAVCLDRFGHHGNGSYFMQNLMIWGVITESIHNFTMRCITALELTLKGQIRWPNRQERQQIFDAFALKGFPGCVGLIDGTTFSLTQRPAIDGQRYYDKIVDTQSMCK